VPDPYGARSALVATAPSTTSPGVIVPTVRPSASGWPGDVVDGAVAMSADRLPYGSGTTFDLLPSGPTGRYWADGIPLASTLGR